MGWFSSSFLWIKQRNRSTRERTYYVMRTWEPQSLWSNNHVLVIKYICIAIYEILFCCFCLTARKILMPNTHSFVYLCRAIYSNANASQHWESEREMLTWDGVRFQHWVSERREKEIVEMLVFNTRWGR